jgi:restriction system protein
MEVVIFLVVATALLFGVAFLIGASNDSERQREEDERLAREKRLSEIRENALIIVDQYLIPLKEQRNKLVYLDPYGDLCGTEKWVNEIGNFMSKKIVPHLPPMADPEVLNLVTAIYEHIEKKIAEIGVQSGADLTEMNGIQFEHHCADLFRSVGWDVRVTQASGDHGADLIISRDGHTAVVQCKLYSSPVGNKAVQEAFSAKTFYSANEAIVVSKSGYTPHARQAAGSMNVRLIDVAEITEIYDRVQS